MENVRILGKTINPLSLSDFKNTMSFYVRFLLERIYTEEKELCVICKHLPLPIPPSSLHPVYILLQGKLKYITSHVFRPVRQAF